MSQKFCPLENAFTQNFTIFSIDEYHHAVHHCKYSSENGWRNGNVESLFGLKDAENKILTFILAYAYCSGYSHLHSLSIHIL